MQTMTIAPNGASERSTIVPRLRLGRPKRKGASAIRLSLLAGIAAMAPTAPSFAQEGPAASSSEPGISDIVVTAQRREERNQSVPIAITAFSQEKLTQNNITGAQDLSGLVPSLVVGANGSGSRDTQSPTLRGQGATFQGASAVVIYMNEVPLPAAVTLNQQGGPGNFIDLENLQVLAGPQGTLFGRNTTGGAMLLVPRKPTDQLEGYVEGSIGNYDLRGLEGMVNVPIVEDKLLVRAVGAYNDRAGFTRDVVWNKRRDDVHWYTGRIGIMMKPVERFSNYLMMYGTRSSTNGTGFINTGINIAGMSAFGLCQEGPSIPAMVSSCDVYRKQAELANELGPRKTRLGVDEFQYVRTWGLTNTTSYELTDELTLRNIVSYQRFKGSYSYDSDGTPLQQNDQNPTRYPDFPVSGLSEFGLPLAGFNNLPGNTAPRDNLRALTEELQLQGAMLDDHLNFTVGGFYYDQKPVGPMNGPQIVFCPAAFTGFPIPGTAACSAQQVQVGISTRSKALYGQATLDFGVAAPELDGLRLTAGYRYTWDTVKGFARLYTPVEGTGNVVCGSDAQMVPVGEEARCGFSATLKSRAPTWTFGIDYQANRNLLLYAKVSRGFKAGGFNTYSVRPSTRTYEPEKVTSYETGFKSDWRLGAIPLRFNGTYYYSDYNNIQRVTGDFNPETNAGGAQFLGASARIQGVEAEVTVRPIPELELGGNLSYTDADYRNFTYTPLSPTLACNGLVPAGGTADASCNPFQYVTPWIYNLNAALTLPVPDSVGEISLTANYSHRSDQNTEALLPPSQQPGSILTGYGLLNLSLNWQDVGQKGVDLTFFVTNATNKLYRISNTNLYQSLLTAASVYGEPRMYGLKLRYRFGEGR
ncbi:TonB-dependent receptor [Sphingomonas sp. C3-2]|uniref:TonB-dependent receptor n=1 Tax=Sphingomonas sp. C3-2 TaxID=3062169 RepID=UPI00294ABC72|nr:TonB-dependent receptor [Sphingomonas sp. C3-2]WOK37093.1 TonB-dependent receptor [Sphingomonas sp. C3-2]